MPASSLPLLACYLLEAMKPCSREMKITNSVPDLHSHHHQRRPETDASQLQHHVQTPHFDSTFSHDDFFEQMLSTVPYYSPWELDPSTLEIASSASAAVVNGHIELGDLSDETPPLPSSNSENVAYQFDESANIASKLRGYQISQTTQATKVAMMMLQQQLLMSRGMATAGDSGLLQMPLSLDGGNMEAGSCNGVVEGSSSFKCPNPISDGLVPSLYQGFAGSLHGSGPGNNVNQSQQFHQPQGNLTQIQNIGVTGAVSNPPQSSVAAGPGSGGAAPAQPRQRVRARRGQATDPHSIAERLRRERIAERMKSLQELVPNANKTDKASMLDEIIDYVKFLQLQVKVLSMSRLGGAAAPIPPLLADILSEGGGGVDCVQSNGNSGAIGRNCDGAQTPSSTDTMTVTENQVIKLMEEDMGSAMQYLQGKGLCLMPISLATAISTATCRPIMNNHSCPITPSNGGECPTSPSMSVLTVQSAATLGNGAIDRSHIKDAASVSKP